FSRKTKFFCQDRSICLRGWLSQILRPDGPKRNALAGTGIKSSTFSMFRVHADVRRRLWQRLYKPQPRIAIPEATVETMGIAALTPAINDHRSGAQPFKPPVGAENAIRADLCKNVSRLMNSTSTRLFQFGQ